MKSMKEIGNLGNVRTMNTVGARSIPKVHRSVYLDLYVLKKEKDRLEKEIFLLDKRGKIVRQLLSDIDRRIISLQEEIRDLPEIKAGKQAKRDRLRTMPLKY
jgi:hypothetical protein